MAVAPHIVLLNGAIDIDLSLVAEATASFYMNVASKDDFTVAVKATMTLNMANFLGEGWCTEGAH